MNYQILSFVISDFQILGLSPRKSDIIAKLLKVTRIIFSIFENNFFLFLYLTTKEKLMEWGFQI